MEQSQQLEAGPAVSVSKQQMIIMILQFLGEEKFNESARKLEQESGLYFDMKYFEDQVLAGEWEEVERYLSGFLKVNDDDESRTIFMEIKTQKCLEILVREQNEIFSNYGDVMSRRTALIDNIRTRIRLHPSLLHKLKFPELEASRLRKVTESHIIQNELCKDSNPSLDMNMTRCTNNTCSSNKGIDIPSSHTTLTKLIPRRKVSHNLEGHRAGVYSADDLPKNFLKKLGEGRYNYVTSMDFHPREQTLLLVGLRLGEIGMWSIPDSGTKLRSRKLKPFDATTEKNYHPMEVNRCAWSPDGFKLGVAFSIQIVQIYSFSSTKTLRQLFEIEAHVGGVNGIAFVNPKDKSRILTCGDDKTIKMWDANSGVNYHTFEGHEAPVCCICPRYNQGACLFYSISADGKMKAWRYDSLELIANYDSTPGLKYMRLAFNADETRFFCSVKNEQGACQLIEWCGRGLGVIKRTYFESRNKDGYLEFETVGNRLLAVGDKGKIKFWDMDNENMLASTHLEKNQAPDERPRIRANKAGSLLSATRSSGGLVILATADALSENKKAGYLSKQGNASRNCRKQQKRVETSR